MVSSFWALPITGLPGMDCGIGRIKANAIIAIHSAVIRTSCRCGVVLPHGKSMCDRCKSQRPSKPVNDAYHDPLYRKNRAILVNYTWKHGLPCWLCGRPFERKTDITADHVITLANGGTHDLGNLAPAHKSCNSHRGNMQRWHGNASKGTAPA